MSSQVRVGIWFLVVIVVCSVAGAIIILRRGDWQLALVNSPTSKIDHSPENSAVSEQVTPATEQVMATDSEPTPVVEKLAIEILSLDPAGISSIKVRRQTAEIAPPIADLYEPSKSPVDSDPLFIQKELPGANSTQDTPLVRPAQPLPDSIDNNASGNGSTVTEADPDNASDAPAVLALPPEPREPSLLVKCWPRPKTLIEQLQALSKNVSCREWTEAVLKQIDQLIQADSLSAKEAGDAIRQLEKLADDALRLANRPDFKPQRSELMQARYALARRVVIWHRLYEITSGRSAVSDFQVDPNVMATRITAIENPLRRLQQSDRWREYLLLDDLTKLVDADQIDDRSQRVLARRILLRIASPALNSEQRAFFDQPVFEQFQRELKLWADEPVDYRDMLVAMEGFQDASNSAQGKLVADAYQILRWSPNEEIALLAKDVDNHYRNANIRLAISSELLNRLLPKLKNSLEKVDEDILGAQVMGRSEASTRLMIRLLPDHRRLRLGIEASGEVASDTEAYSGPATFYNQSLGKYRARKLLIVDRQGLRIWRSEADAESSTDVTDVQTDYDGIPFLSSFAQSIAMMQRDEQAADAQYEAEEKIASKAESRLDQEVHHRLAIAEKNFKTKVLDPLISLKLNPMARDLQTTAQRLIVRYRLAGFAQMAAYTPRPLAPSDSLLSMQIHESAINNILQQLRLDGRRIELHELHREINTAFGRKDFKVPEDLPTGVTLHFADHDAVRVRFEDGRVSVTIKLVELSKRHGNRWRNFEVCGNYDRKGSGIDARLVRESYVQLDGEDLGLGDQIALRGIFTKVFSNNRPIPLVPKRFAEESKLKDLRANQFVVDNQWIGIAIGPDRRIDQSAEKDAPKPRRQARRTR